MIKFENQNDLTFSIAKNINKALKISIENNDENTLRTLLYFSRKIIQLSIKKRSSVHFNQYIYFPSNIYIISYSLKKHNNNFSRILDYCANQGPEHLKEIISYDLSYGRINNGDGGKSNHPSDQFYYLSFKSFSQLLYQQITNRDLVSFEKAIDHYNQISNSDVHQIYSLKSNIMRLEWQNEDGLKDDEIDSLKSDLKGLNQFEEYRRHVILGLKYWSYYLFQINEMDAEIAERIISKLDFQYYDPKNILEDLIFFGNFNSLEYMNWGNWDHKERLSGETWIPSLPEEWLIAGFFVDQIRANQFFINSEDFDYTNFDIIESVIIKIKQYLEGYKQNFSKWHNLFHIGSVDELEEKANKILSSLAVLKRKRVSAVEEQIANAPLSATKINIFKEKVGKAWKSQARINFLFKEYKNIELIEDEAIKLKHIGQRTFFQKAKSMFIDGDHYQPIYGVEEMGGQVGRWEDNFFFSNLFLSNFNKVSENTTVQVIDQAIVELENNNHNPNLILLSFETYFSDKTLQQSNFFVPNKDNESEISHFLLGKYKGIPVYTSYSELLKIRILVSKFEEAFVMRYKTNPQWYENELTVDVKEVSNEEASRKLDEQPEKWNVTEDGIELGEDEALTLVKTSVIIDIWSTIDFQVKNNTAFIIGNLNK